MPYYRCAASSATSYSAADSKLFVVPGAVHNFSRTLRAQPQAAGEARRAVGTLALPEPIRGTLSLIVSELVTNSILHAGLTVEDTVDLHVDEGGPQVRLA